MTPPLAKPGHSLDDIVFLVQGEGGAVLVADRGVVIHLRMCNIHNSNA